LQDETAHNKSIANIMAGRCINEHLELCGAVVPADEFLCNICFYFELVNNNLAFVPSDIISNSITSAMPTVSNNNKSLIIFIGVFTLI